MSKEQEYLAESLQDDLENLERYIQEYSLFLPLAIYSINPVGIIVDVNNAGKELAEFEEIELIGKEIDVLFKEEKKIGSHLDEILKKGSVKNRELILVTKKKKEIPVRISASIRKDREDNIIGCFIAVHDITEIKKFQDKLELKVKQRTNELENAKNKLFETLKETKTAKARVEDEKDKTFAIISNFIDPILIIDNKEKLSIFNPKAKEILGFSDKLIGQKIDSANNYSITNFTNYTNKKFNILKTNFEFNDSVEEEMEVNYKGETITYKIITTKIIGNKKEFLGLMKIFNDLSREKKINSLKSEFVSIAAHQLRTPLSAIKWAIRMVLDGDAGTINDEQKDLLTKGFISNERMIRLVNDLLNVSRIEEGRYGFNFEELNMSQICDPLVEGMEDLFKKNEIIIDYIKAKEDYKVYVDRERIRIVLQNLLENAVKYTQRNGRIILTVEKAGDKIKVSVKDNGVGIPKKDQEKLFTKFFRAQNVVRIQTDGTGLGLFIAKNIIDKHNGEIGYVSEEGKGSEFYFTIPIKK
jgi:PAS domain S-box-containing protein